MIKEGSKGRQIMQFATEHIIIIYQVVSHLPLNHSCAIFLTVYGCYTLSVLTYPLSLSHTAYMFGRAPHLIVSICYCSIGYLVQGVKPVRIITRQMLQHRGVSLRLDCACGLHITNCICAVHSK